MALTITQVAHPNSQITEGDLLGFKARLVTITFDSSYLTTGEVLTASSMGWIGVIGAIEVSGVGNTTGALSVTTVVRPNSSLSQLTFQAQETAATVDTSHKEVTSAADLSTYSGTFIVLGF